MLLDYLGGIHPATLKAIEEKNIQRSEGWLLQPDHNRMRIGRLYRFNWHLGDTAAERARLGETAAQAREAVIVEDDILGNEFAPVHRRLVVPVNTLADFEDYGQGSGVS